MHLAHAATDSSALRLRAGCHHPFQTSAQPRSGRPGKVSLVLAVYAPPAPKTDSECDRARSAATETAGGIIIPDQYQSKVNQGEVLAVGPGARDKDVSQPFVSAKLLWLAAERMSLTEVLKCDATGRAHPDGGRGRRQGPTAGVRRPGHYAGRR